MAFTNFIISSLMALEGPNVEKPDFNMQFSPAPVIEPGRKAAVMEDDDIARVLAFAQSFNLVYQDIYIYTKPALYRGYSNGGYNYISGELNPVANLFFSNNLWDLAFISANAFNYMMFSNKYLSYVYSVGLELIEVWAISTWQPTTARQINVNAVLYVHMF